METPTKASDINVIMTFGPCMLISTPILRMLEFCDRTYKTVLFFKNVVVLMKVWCIFRTKALVLELLAAVCLVRGGHEIILSAFDNFKEVPIATF